jgi:hypothetical protein
MMAFKDVFDSTLPATKAIARLDCSPFDYLCERIKYFAIGTTA